MRSRRDLRRANIIIAVVAVLVSSAAFAGGYLIARMAVTSPTIVETTTITEDHYWNTSMTLLEEVLEWVERDRGLRFNCNVSLVVLTKEWVAEHWGLGYLNRTDIRIKEELYKALFMVPKEYNLTRIKLGQSGCVVAASADKTVYVVREYFDPSRRVEAGEILAHELTHILQGIHFKIPVGRFHDEKQAIRAVVEGDAGTVATDYLLAHGGVKQDRGHEENYDAITSIWLFPYLYGEDFIQYIRELRGWRGVNQVYSRMPGSTSEILHPEKYLSGWRPTMVRIAVRVGDGWRLQLRDRLGEYFIRQMLRAHLPMEVAVKAADGWKGDLLEYYANDGRRLLYWKIAWEDRMELEEFLKAFERLLEEVGAERIGEHAWIKDGIDIRLVVDGSSVLIIENFSAAG